MNTQRLLLAPFLGALVLCLAVESPAQSKWHGTARANIKFLESVNSIVTAQVDAAASRGDAEARLSASLSATAGFQNGRLTSSPSYNVHLDARTGRWSGSASANCQSSSWRFKDVSCSVAGQVSYEAARAALSLSINSQVGCYPGGCMVGSPTFSITLGL